MFKLKNMKKENLLITIAAIFYMLLSSQIYAEQFDVLVDNSKVPVKILDKNGKLYISVTDLAKYYKDLIVINHIKKQVELFTAPIKNVELAPGKQVEAAGISGEIFLEGRSGVEFPADGAEVFLYLYNPSIPDDMSTASFMRMITGTDNEYNQTHGFIRKVLADESGKFFIEATPGDYEIISVYYTLKGKSGRFWRKRINVKKQETQKITFKPGEAYEF